MYKMDYEIRIGEMVLPILTSVKIRKDVTKLTDTATIVCPSVAHGRKLKFASQIAKWQQVTIRLGYDGKLRTEFEGYVKSVAVHDNQLNIECEDALLLFQRVTLPNMEMKDTTLKEVLEYVVEKVNDYIRSEGLGEPLGINCAYSYGYDKFTFKDVTAYKFMELIQKEGKPNIYIRDSTLNILPQYTNPVGFASYDTKVNICKDGLKLKWRSEEDRNLIVKVTARKKTGEEIEAVVGKEGGDVIELKLNSIRSQEDLQKIAEGQYSQEVYTGYEGSFDSWLIPFCDANYTISVQDSANGIKSGSYYCLAIEVELSSSGGHRKVFLGARIR